MLAKRHIISAALGAVMLLGPAAASAQSVRDVRPVVTAPSLDNFRLKARNWSWQQAQRSISPAEAKSIARKRIGGRVVEIFRKGDTYVVRVMGRGNKLSDVYIDANTGRVTKVVS